MSASWALALTVVDQPSVKAAPEEEPARPITPTGRLPARGDGSGMALAGVLRKPKTKS
jgi:hypothetical protein